MEGGKKYMDMFTKVLCIVATIFIVIGVVTFGKHIFYDARDISTENAKQLNDLSDELSESELSRFDGTEWYGSDVVNFIKKKLGDYGTNGEAPIYVEVKTSLSINKYKNGGDIEKIQDFTDGKYIKPTAKFKSEVKRSNNNVIIGVSFIQE